MLQNTSPANAQRWKSKLPGSDRDGGYGWISIALHWLAGIAIIVLLFAGDSIGTAGEPARRVHTTIASCAWLILAARIVWRLVEGHPPPASGQGRFSYGAGVAVHYALLAGIALMLVSGPVAGWSSGGGIEVFDLRIPGAKPHLPALYAVAREAHTVGAVVLAVGTSAHIAGVLKHMFFDRDNLFDRIMVPPKRRTLP
jgi:cytochrome b561